MFAAEIPSFVPEWILEIGLCYDVSKQLDSLVIFIIIDA